MTSFSVQPHQQVDAQLRDSRVADFQLRKASRNEHAHFSLEWFLAQQKNKRQVSRSGLRTRQENARSLLLSSQALKRSMLGLSRQKNSFLSQDCLVEGETQAAQPQTTKGGDLPEFNFLLRNKKPKRPKSVTRKKQEKVQRPGEEVKLSESQLIRKIHRDLQDYAIELIEARSEQKIATKLKLTLSSLNHQLQFQTLAIKFWILITNLQFHDVRKLSMGFVDRQISTRLGGLAGKEIEVLHTSLPVKLFIYESIIPLFAKALGAIYDPQFSPVAIPVPQDQRNRLIKRKQQTLLLGGFVFFDKFVNDLGLMLGVNLLKLTASDVAYIYRKCYLAMTHRFTDDLCFLSLQDIESPFLINDVLQAQRGAGVTPSQPLIIPSSLHSEKDQYERMSRASQLQIVQSNDKAKGNASDFLNTNLQVKSQPTSKRHSFIHRDKQISSQTNKLEVKDQALNQRRQNSSTNLKVASLATPEFAIGEQEQHPRPPHIRAANKQSTSGLFSLQMQENRITENARAESRCSRSSASVSIRQSIKLGLPDERSVPRRGAGSPDSSEEGETDQNSSQREELSLSDSDSNLTGGYKSKLKKVGASAQTQAAEDELFDFEKLHIQRQALQEEIALKIALTQQRIAALQPHQIPFPRRSCLECLREAEEFLQDQETRVRKTPAGFNRPRTQGRSVVLSRRRQEDPSENNARSFSFLARTRTKMLDQETDNLDIYPVTRDNSFKLTTNDERNGANATNPLEDPSPKLQTRHEELKLEPLAESSHAGALPPPQPVVHVTAHGNAINDSFMDSGFLRYRLEEEADQIFASSDNHTSNAQSDPSFRKEIRRGNTLASQYALMSPNYQFNERKVRLDQMTKRLVQETILDSVFKQSLVKKARARHEMQENDQKQFSAVIGKLDQEQLVRQQRQPNPQSSLNAALNRSTMAPLLENSLIKEEKSLESVQKTNATTSQEDSQFVTQEAMTRPKFTQQELNATYEPHQMEHRLLVNNDLNSVTGGPQLVSAPHFGSPSKGQAALKATQEAKTGTGLRRLVYGVQKNRRVLGSTSPDIDPDQKRSPILVQSVDRETINEMEGKDFGPPYCKGTVVANAKSGREETAVSQILVSGLARGAEPQLAGAPQDTSSSSLHMMLDDKRKSYVTAKLSGCAEKEEQQSEPELEDANLLQEPKSLKADQITTHESNKAQQPEAKVSDYQDDIDRKQSQKFTGVKSQKHFTQQSSQLSRSNRQALRASADSFGYQSCSSSRELATSNDARTTSLRNLATKSKASVGAGKTLSSSREVVTQHRLLNIQVREENQVQRKGSQISVISISQRDRQVDKLSKAKQLERLQQKSQQVFPFSHAKNQIKRKAPRGISPLLNKSQDGSETKKIQDSLFALRRANKNRRQYMHHATQDKRERIVNSKIPGVDYSRAFDPNSSQLYDSLGNQLPSLDGRVTANFESQGGQLLIPEELIGKMNKQGFVIMETLQQSPNKATEPNVLASIRVNGLNTDKEQHPSAQARESRRQPSGQATSLGKAKSRVTSQGDLGASKGCMSNSESDISPAMLVLESRELCGSQQAFDPIQGLPREIIVKGQKSQDSKPYQMVIRSQADALKLQRKETGVSTRLEGRSSLSPVGKQPSFLASQTNVLQLKLAEIEDEKANEPATGALEKKLKHFKTSNQLRMTLQEDSISKLVSLQVENGADVEGDAALVVESDSQVDGLHSQQSASLGQETAMRQRAFTQQNNKNNKVGKE